MPYTRNTRIKHVKKLHNPTFTAEVEYRYPLTKITKWVSICDVDYGPFMYWFWMKEKGFEGNLAWQADRDCLHNPKLEDLSGDSLEWAKALIDRYHELFDEQEAETIVEYIKYP